MINTGGKSLIIIQSWFLSKYNQNTPIDLQHFDHRTSI